MEKLGKHWRPALLSVKVQLMVLTLELLLSFLIVEHLQLTNNALEGTLPTELGNLANLSKLKLLVWLLDAAPYWYSFSPIVAVLGVGRNLFNGTLPSELGLLNSLGMLSRNCSSLWVKVDQPFLFCLPLLVTLGIEGNNIEGTIPTELASIDPLRFLSLRVNNLSGPIPSELGSLSQLAVLEVDANNLSGSVPLEICGLRATTLTSVLVDCDRITCTSLCCDNCWIMVKWRKCLRR